MELISIPFHFFDVLHGELTESVMLSSALISPARLKHVDSVLHSNHSIVRYATLVLLQATSPSIGAAIAVSAVVGVQCSTAAASADGHPSHWLQPIAVVVSSSLAPHAAATGGHSSSDTDPGVVRHASAGTPGQRSSILPALLQLLAGKFLLRRSSSHARVRRSDQQ